ncbi:10504_t:CDS:2, partial [Racocetra fulgida]
MVSELSAIDAYGGFRSSLLTDKVQGWAIAILLIISAIGFGATVKLDPEVVNSSPLLQSNKLGWQLLYIMPVAITFANLFHQGYWQRAFSSKNDRVLVHSAIYGSLLLFPTLFLIGFTGIIAAWAGTWPGPDPENPVEPFMSFFSLYTLLPDWVKGFVIVLAVSLSCSAYDTLQSAMVSTIAYEGAQLLILSNGLYTDDYSVLGAFIVAPIGSIVFTFLAFGVRLFVMFILAKGQGREFEFPKPQPKAEPDSTIDKSEDTSEETENAVTKDTVKTVAKNTENANIKDSYSMTE